MLSGVDWLVGENGMDAVEVLTDGASAIGVGVWGERSSTGGTAPVFVYSDPHAVETNMPERVKLTKNERVLVLVACVVVSSMWVESVRRWRSWLRVTV